MREDNVQMTSPSCKDTSESSYLPNGMKSGFPTQEEVLVPTTATYGCLILPEQSSPTVLKLQNQPNKKATTQNYSKWKSLTSPKHSGWLASSLQQSEGSFFKQNCAKLSFLLYEYIDQQMWVSCQWKNLTFFERDLKWK